MIHQPGPVWICIFIEWSKWGENKFQLKDLKNNWTGETLYDQGTTNFVDESVNVEYENLYLDREFYWSYYFERL